MALMLKLLTPAGFMPVMSDGHIVVSLCSSSGPTKISVVIPGKADSQSRNEQGHSKADQPCAFSGLSAPILGAVDPILLAAAVLFVMALGAQVRTAAVAATAPYLRPPLRGPPAIL